MPSEVDRLQCANEVSYFLHHARALSSAAAVGHGRVIQRHIADLRTRSLTCPALPSPAPALSLAVP